MDRCDSIFIKEVNSLSEVIFFISPAQNQTQRVNHANQIRKLPRKGFSLGTEKQAHGTQDHVPWGRRIEQKTGITKYRRIWGRIRVLRLKRWIESIKLVGQQRRERKLWGTERERYGKHRIRRQSKSNWLE